MQDVIIPVVPGYTTDLVYSTGTSNAAVAADVPAIFESQKAVLSHKQKTERKTVSKTAATPRSRKSVTATVALPVVVAAAAEVMHIIP
jgi:hypothetical protein